MRQVILYCPTDDCECCPALFLSGRPERPFAIMDETEPRGTVFLTEAELNSLGTDAPLIEIISGDNDVTLVGSDTSQIVMTTAYYQRLTGSIRDGSTEKAVKAAAV